MATAADTAAALVKPRPGVVQLGYELIALGSHRPDQGLGWSGVDAGQLGFGGRGDGGQRLEGGHPLRSGPMGLVEDAVHLLEEGGSDP